MHNSLFVTIGDSLERLTDHFSDVINVKTNDWFVASDLGQELRLRHGLNHLTLDKLLHIPLLISILHLNLGPSDIDVFKFRHIRMIKSFQVGEFSNDRSWDTIVFSCISYI